MNYLISFPYSLPAMRKVTSDNYREDPNFPRVSRAVHEILQRKIYVAPVELFQEMKLLEAKAYEDWRLGRVPFLEKVIKCSPVKISRLLRLLARHAHDCGLKPSTTVYCKWGKGAKTRLRFTQFGNQNLEAAWSCHFCRTDKAKQTTTPPTESEVTEGAVASSEDDANETAARNAESAPPPESWSPS